MRRVLVFANPIAGRGRGRALAESIERELRIRGYKVHSALTQAEAAGLRVPPEQVRATIIVGGDGTLRSVAQWAIQSALDAQHASHQHAIPFPLLIVPIGTANLMGRHLGITWNAADLPRRVADALERGRIVHLDAARTGRGVFLLVAGVGFDAAVVHELVRVRRGPISMASYGPPMLRCFLRYGFPCLEVVADGRHIFGPAPALAVVGNVREYGTGFALLPHARPDDQLLDLCIMPCASRGELLRLFMSAATGQHLQEEGVIYTKATSIHIHAPRPVPVELDGEAAGFTPLHIDLLPGRIPFIVPPKP